MIKRIIFCITAMLLALATKADDIQIITYPLTENGIGICKDVPFVRDLEGGTVFDITYEEEVTDEEVQVVWSNEMKGAFEYACKIWAETLPTTLPIKITASLGTIKQDSTALSEVKATGYMFPNSYSDGKRHLSSQIKAVSFKEYMRGHIVTFGDFLTDETLINYPDFQITYNKQQIDEFCFSLDASQVPSDKYDFVTVVLRDIARALGFFSDLTANINNRKVLFTGTLPTPFEKLIRDALSTTDGKEAYERATNGSFAVKDLNLYAPDPWINGVSLNYFIPDEQYKITQLLDYKWGRGDVIRDISDYYTGIFYTYLGWTENYTVGNSSNSFGEQGSTEEVIPYKGTISLPVSEQYSTINLHPQSLSNNENEPQSPIDFSKYHYFYGYTNTDIDGWTVSILKADGTWDVIYYQVGSADLSLDLNSVEFHETPDTYARTSDGYLRCRVTFKKELNPQKSYDVRYFALDYLPQTPEAQFEEVIPSVLSRAIADDEYSKDIKIGLKNLEGTKRIIVEQLDEWSDTPFRFEVPDFKKGYFVATVDKEFASQFTVVAYNDNGYAQSEVLTVDPIEPAMESYNANICGDYIDIYTVGRKIANKKSSIVAYDIIPLGTSSLMPLLKGDFCDDNTRVNISSLSSGLYMLNYYDSTGMKYSYKFAKR